MEKVSSFTTPPVYSQDSYIGQLNTAARNVGDKMQEAETNLLNFYDAMNNGKEIEINGTKRAVTEGDIEAATVSFQRAQRVYEMFSTMLKGIHERMMSIIRRLAN